jgi:transposase InsO family protein
VAVIVDHFSRRVMGTTSFTHEPTSKAVQLFLDHTRSASKAQPRHLICDQGKQFWCKGFKRWCHKRQIKPRYGAVHQHGSIAVVERFIQTLKQNLRLLVLVSLDEPVFRRELHCITDWFNEFRPHTSLGGRTPNEVYHRRFPAVRRPRHEPRSSWPRGSPCAKPWALARNGPGTPLELNVEFHAGRRHLPIVTLKRAA